MPISVRLRARPPEHEPEHEHEPFALQLRDFHYDLPAELIAQQPLPERAASRLLLLDAARGELRDLQFRDLPELLCAGDLLVFNDTRVVPARLAGQKSTGGRVEIFLERPVAREGSAELATSALALVQLRASKGFRAGDALSTAGGVLRVLERRDDLWLVEFPAPVFAFLEQYGSVPLPPYIERAASALDRERYQSVLARQPGAVAAPTASLHFDTALLARLAARGVERALITLHVGAGTFQPVREQELAAHRMHSEWFEVNDAVIQAVQECHARGGRVVAVGTTVARALEAAASGGELRAGRGETAIFLRPGSRFHVIDALITNFHLPQSTLLMLVCAFAGTDAALAAYAHAVQQRYRFFSYGDAMLIWPVVAAAR